MTVGLAVRGADDADPDPVSGARPHPQTTTTNTAIAAVALPSRPRETIPILLQLVPGHFVIEETTVVRISSSASRVAGAGYATQIFERLIKLVGTVGRLGMATNE